MDEVLACMPIGHADVDSCVRLDLSAQLALDFYRAFRQRRSPARSQFLVTEFAVLAVILIFLWPTSLVVVRAFGDRPEEPAAIGAFLGAIGLLTLLIFAGFNLYLYQRSRSLKSLARLLAEIDQFNCAVGSLELAVRLAQLGQKPALGTAAAAETIEVLSAIRGSLLRALEIESLMRYRAGAPLDALLAQLEGDLAAIAALEAHCETRDRHSLLADALQVGWAVRREVRALRRSPVAPQPSAGFKS